MIDPEQSNAARKSKAWPCEEARRILKRLERRPSEKGYALFETGYGPSGLPHLGTFGEVQRTVMVIHAFRTLSDFPTRLFAFSDDMDGMRKVPENVPRQELLHEHLGKPLTSVPDPFGTHPSFGEHNNARLRAFLDRFGFEYEFRSATECYRRGEFDEVLLRVLARHEEIRETVLPTLGPERRATYSPILPLCPRTGRVLQVPILECNVEAGTVVYADEDGGKVEVPVTGGGCKLQWKADWAMRWTAFDVDYEMAGKDLIESVHLSSRICRLLGGTPPEGFSYEMFLDEQGNKISKSKGNGLAIEEWLRYAPPETLSMFMYTNPRRAKRLHFDVIPQVVDEYAAAVARFEGEELPKRLQNPVWHIHGGERPDVDVPVPYGMLLNLVSASNSADPDVLWGFIRRYVDGVTPQTHPFLDRLVHHAVRFYEDFVRPTKSYRPPTDIERGALAELLERLEALPPDAPSEAIQTEIYTIGREGPFESQKDWFRALYEVLLGQTRGPRMGTFVAIFGLAPFKELIRRALAGENLAEPAVGED